jgi:hypothetical protein
MCVYNCKEIKGFNKIVAYKVEMLNKNNEWVSVFQEEKQKKNIEIEAIGGTSKNKTFNDFLKKLKELKQSERIISYGFFHSFKNKTDAIIFSKKWHYETRVVECNIYEQNNVVFKGEFPHFWFDNNFAESYVSRKIIITDKVVYTNKIKL